MTEQTQLSATHHSKAVIDNGSFGTREITFSTGRLARQAAGSALAQLGDTVVLSATTASKHPQGAVRLLPADGRRRGADVRRRAASPARSSAGRAGPARTRSSPAASSTARCARRFVKGLRNEVQVVETILALDPQHPYDVVAINAASMSTKLSGLPFSGPIGATRMAHIDGTWVAFPTHEELERATFDMVVAGRVLPDGDVAIMMVEAEATEHTLKLVAEGAPKPTEEVVAGGLEAAKPAIRELCRAQDELAAVAAKPVAEFPVFLDYEADVYAAVEAAVARRGRRGAEDRRQGRARGGARPASRTRRTSSSTAQFEGREKEIGAAFRSVTKKEVRARVLRDQVRIDGRGPRDIRPLTAEVGGAAAGARLGAVRARRDPDPGRHHAEHAAHGAVAGHALAGEAQALHAQLQLPALLHR